MFSTPHAFTTDLERAGITLPKAARVALDTLTAVQEAAFVNPTTTLQDDIAAGKVTPSNAADALAAHAQALLVAEKSRQALHDFVTPIERQFKVAIRENADDLIVKLREPFDRAATVVEAAGTYFPSNPTSDQVLAGGTKAVEVWEQLTEAIKALTTLSSLRVQIGDLSRHGEQSATWYIAHAADVTALETAARAFGAPGNRFHNLAAAGFTFRLNTLAEAGQVAALARQVSDQKEAAEREAALEAHRASWAPSLAALDNNARRA